MHTIPREIAQRIVEKIEAGKDFKAYIVVPMFPEGDPSSGPIQEILFWQYRDGRPKRRLPGCVNNFPSRDHAT